MHDRIQYSEEAGGKWKIERLTLMRSIKTSYKFVLQGFAGAADGGSGLRGTRRSWCWFAGVSSPCHRQPGTLIQHFVVIGSDLPPSIGHGSYFPSSPYAEFGLRPCHTNLSIPP